MVHGELDDSKLPRLQALTHQHAADLADASAEELLLEALFNLCRNFNLRLHLNLD